jgi:hypothetical protein
VLAVQVSADAEEPSAAPDAVADGLLERLSSVAGLVAEVLVAERLALGRLPNRRTLTMPSATLIGSTAIDQVPTPSTSSRRSMTVSSSM